MSLETFQLIATSVLVGGALFIIALERLFPYRNQRFFRTGFWTDFAWYSIVQSYVLGILISELINVLDHSAAGAFRWQLLQGWPVWLQVAFFWLTHDLYIYWFHRWQHHSKYLWRTHEAHHSVRDVDWVAGSRSHVVEILINQTIEFAPIVLLGAAPEVAVAKGVLDAVWGMWIHSNVDVRTGWLQYLLNGPEMHRWHHSEEVPPPGVNFSTKIALWDWLFGTAYLPRDRNIGGYGLGPGVTYPENYFIQQVYAFRPMEEDPPSEVSDRSSVADKPRSAAA